MSNNQKLIEAFTNSLGIEKDIISDNFKYGDKGWDSVAHMALIAALEDIFDIMVDTEDVIDLSSFGAAKQILNKYGVSFDS